jgi:hypothetical protein
VAEQWGVSATRLITGNALDQRTLGWGCISMIGEDENALQTTVELVMRDMAQIPASGWRGSKEMSGPQAPSGVSGARRHWPRGGCAPGRSLAVVGLDRAKFLVALSLQTSTGLAAVGPLDADETLQGGQGRTNLAHQIGLSGSMPRCGGSRLERRAEGSEASLVIIEPINMSHSIRANTQCRAWILVYSGKRSRDCVGRTCGNKKSGDAVLDKFRYPIHVRGDRRRAEC